MKEFKDKSILILGLGKEGASSLDFMLKRFPGKTLGLADKSSLNQLGEHVTSLIDSNKNIKLFLEDARFNSIKHHDVIIKSPGISPFHPELIKAEKSGKIISSNTELFFSLCAGQIIGVTGTKGKSTTSALIYDTLKNGGFDARLIGNFGTPMLSSLNGSTTKTVFVAEMSSYQLMSLKKSPHISVLLNIVPEHFDYHQSFDGYVKAKQNITNYQSENDFLIYNALYPIPTRIAEESRARKALFGLKKAGNMNCFIEDGHFVYQMEGNNERVIPTSEVPLSGKFNLQNVMPSIVIGKMFSMPNKAIAQAIRQFKPLEHRLEFAGERNGISFYNDSLATVPEATIEAIKTFAGKNIILIAGGFDRSQQFEPLAQTIIETKVKAVILFHPTGQRIADELVLKAQNKDVVLPKNIFVSNMNEAVKESYRLADEPSIVLLSPASVSFGCFKDYIDRGNRFKEAVNMIIKQHAK